MASDEQRRSLAIRGKKLGRAFLVGIATLVTPDTILAWHRRLVARKWTYPHAGKSNAAAIRAITKLVVRMAKEDSTGGHYRLQGALRHLGHLIAPNTIKKILKRNGIELAPLRGRHTTWKTFLKAHAHSIFAADFFTTEVWTARGLVTHYTLFVVHHASRAVEVVATTVNPGRPSWISAPGCSPTRSQGHAAAPASPLPRLPRPTAPLQNSTRRLRPIASGSHRQQASAQRS